MGKRSIAVVRDWKVCEIRGDHDAMNAASLVKQIVAHVALAVIEDLDSPVSGDITLRHILTHTTGLPNWRAEGEQLRQVRPAGQRWGYSGEGFVLLQHHLEDRTAMPIDELVDREVFAPLGMTSSWLDAPEPGFHGYRPLFTTAADYGQFLAHVLRLDDVRWQPLWPIDDELAWGAGWGLEVGPPTYAWQWGSSADASNFVIGCPSTGDGVVVLTSDPNGRSFYRSIIEQELPGDHASLRVEHNQAWLEL